MNEALTSLNAYPLQDQARFNWTSRIRIAKIADPFPSEIGGTIIQPMRRVVCWLLLFAVGTAIAQDKLAPRRLPPVSKLRSTLLALSEPGASRPALSQQLAEQLMSLAEKDCNPSSTAVANFSDELSKSLLEKHMTDAQALLLEQSIREVLRCTGATFTSATSFRQTLLAVGVDPATAQVVTTRFIEIGEEVRGPDDLHVQSE